MLHNCAKSCHQDIPDSFYDIQAEDIDGNMVDFNSFRDKVVYIVNVASEVWLYRTHTSYSSRYVVPLCYIYFSPTFNSSLFVVFSAIVRIHYRELSIATSIRRISSKYPWRFVFPFCLVFLTSILFFLCASSSPDIYAHKSI